MVLNCKTSPTDILDVEVVDNNTVNILFEGYFENTGVCVDLDRSKVEKLFDYLKEFLESSN